MNVFVASCKEMLTRAVKSKAKDTIGFVRYVTSVTRMRQLRLAMTKTINVVKGKEKQHFLLLSGTNLYFKNINN